MRGFPSGPEATLLHQKAGYMYATFLWMSVKLFPCNAGRTIYDPEGLRSISQMTGDVTQALRDAENTLRDFIVLVLSKGTSKWVDRCGVTSDRIMKWKERQVIESRRQNAGVVEERLIYYADFYDLKTILKKNWSSGFSVALGDWKTFEVYLGELEKLRDADAHRRELLPHQKHLILGVSGEIRNRIVRYRSKMETPNDCFPRIESVRDNMGNLWVPTSSDNNMRVVLTNNNLHPGDILDFVVTATDPEDCPLEYAVGLSRGVNYSWQADHNLRFVIENCHISRLFSLNVSIRSTRSYHAEVDRDDHVLLLYGVLPASNS